MIERIKKFIPRSEFKKIYDALFKSHMSYCISSWGGVSDYKLQSIFAIQKRFVRLFLAENVHMTMLNIMQLVPECDI